MAAQGIAVAVWIQGLNGLKTKVLSLGKQRHQPAVSAKW
jgi:hypothetical protein